MAGTMSLPPVHDFEYYIGDTGEFSVTVKNSDQTLYDLTGFTSKFVISDTLSMNPTWSIACESSIIGSTVFCTISHAMGNQLGGKTKVYYDVEVTDGTFVLTILRGSINLTVGVNEVV